jgi:glycerophosphoryl diester phosphodiesterase
VSGYLDGPLPRVLAHRGLASAGAPENTLLAFEHAVTAGARFIETDVHVSSDGIAVIAHDPDLRRLAGLDRRVTDLTAAELAAVDVGGGQGIPRLAEALDAFPGIRFNIDVKTLAAAHPTAGAILDADALDRVLVTSFDETRRRTAVRLLCGVATSASGSVVLRTLIAAARGSAAGVRRSLRGIDALQVPERYRGVPVVTPRMLRLVHAAGVEVHVWTVNDADDMRRLVRAGVDGLVTDRADLALEVAAAGH